MEDGRWMTEPMKGWKMAKGRRKTEHAGWSLDDDDPACLAGRAADRLVVDRGEAPHVDHLDVDPLRREEFGRLQGAVEHQQPAEDGRVRPRAADGGPVERDDVVALGDLARRV